ncbi:MAG TPA: DEDD exonuclease domain-containing protein [Mycobacteriales bacterium]|nr:DEDD exonuclease domain-containing protein [Mycobacteriales bacterium]
MTTSAAPPGIALGPVPHQASFDELGVPLCEVTFVVVDLETTGGSPLTSAITEIGAVKVRGGEQLGEFQTLVNPHCEVPPFISVLTGITEAMVAGAPSISGVLPSFLEWAKGSVLVAHNAPFDLGFLRAAADQLGIPWPGFDSVDTARLARRVLHRDEAPNCKLSTLSRVFRTTTTPCHRALADARATTDVLHGLLERVGNLGVGTYEELVSFTGMATAAQRRKRYLADGLPDGPGVYIFRDHRGQPLYIGRSRHVRARVRQYFLASEPRSRMAEMVGIAERVDAIACAHPLEAEVRELRLIAEHKPRYNRRSRFPERASWLKLTAEPYPRLALVRRVSDDGATYLGPFGSARTAQAAMAALHEAVPLRQCTQRISPARPTSACVLAGMGRCSAPCEGGVSRDDYAPTAAAARALMTGDPRPLIEAVRRRIATLSAQQRYEEAAAHRDRASAFVRVSARMQRLAALSGCPQLVAARPGFAGGWDLAVVRYGRLAAASAVPPGAPPMPYVEALVATAEVVDGGIGPAPAASAEEMEHILGWLSGPGARLVDLDGTWCSPADGAGALQQWLSAAPGGGRDSARPFADRRALRPVHRPARAVV